MGKGDRKTRRGKFFKKSHGKTRPRKKKKKKKSSGKKKEESPASST